MLSVEQLRKIDPELKHLSDDEVLQVCNTFYALGQIMYEDWEAQRGGSKNPFGVLQDSTESGTLTP